MGWLPVRFTIALWFDSFAVCIAPYSSRDGSGAVGSLLDLQAEWFRGGFGSLLICWQLWSAHELCCRS